MEKNRIIATMATFKLRIDSLQDSINSIINQVDELRIYLNDYDDIPSFLIKNKIKVFLGKECDGNIKAKGKFYKCDDFVGYHVSIDDDLIYPENYIEIYLKKMIEYDNKVILTSLGKIAKPKSSNYYNDNLFCYHFQRETLHDYSVNMGGTGVMMYHTDIFKPSYDKILNGGYIDLFIGIQALEQRIPIISIKHKPNWICFNEKENKRLNSTLFEEGKKNYKEQTNIMNSITWERLIPEKKSNDYSSTPEKEVIVNIKKVKKVGLVKNKVIEEEVKSPMTDDAIIKNKLNNSNILYLNRVKKIINTRRL